MAERRPLITAADMDRMSPQKRADVIDASLVINWEDFPEPFRSEVLATARELGKRLRGDG